MEEHERQRPEDEEGEHTLVGELRHEVEELREEIEHAVEQAVEHVPKPVRWTVGKLVRLAVLSLLGLIVLAVISTVLYLANRTELVARELTLVLNGALARHTDVQVEIGDIRGNPARHVRILRPRVRFVDGDRPVLLEAPWIDLSYSPWDVFHPSHRGVTVVVESPTIWIRRGPDGKIRLPEWKGGGKGGEGSTSEGVEIQLKVRGGTVVTPAPLTPVRGLELDLLAALGGRTQAVVRRLAWSEGPWNTAKLEVAGEVTAGDSVRAQLRYLRTPSVELSGLMTWRKQAPNARVHLDVKRVDWRWLAKVTENNTLDVPGSGWAILDATGSPVWSGIFRAGVQWDDLPAQGAGSIHWEGGRFTIPRVDMTSAAGTLTGDVSWTRAAWEIGGRVTNGNPERWGAIGLDGWPAGTLNGAFRYSVDTGHRIQTARLNARLGPSELEGWRADSAAVAVRFPGAGSDSFRVDLLRRGGQAMLLGASGGNGWTGTYEATNYPLDEWPDGRASGIHGVLRHGTGTVEERSGSLHVTGNLEGASTTWLGMEAGHWRLAGVQGVLLPKPDLGASGMLQDVKFLGIHFDSAATPFVLGDRTIALENLTAQAGDTLLTMAGRSNWTDQGWRLDLDRASAKSRQFDWTAEPGVAFSGDPHGVRFERLHARDGDATLDISGTWAGPGGAYDWTARAQALDLGRIGLPPDLGLTGKSDVALQVTGASGNPQWHLEATARRPGWQGHVLDSMRVELAGSPGRLDVRRAQGALDGGVLDGQLVFDRTEKSWPDTLTPDGVVRWLASAERWEGEVEATQLPIDDLRHVVPAARDWRGRLGGRMAIVGRPSAPDLNATVNARPLSWQAVTLENLEARLHYSDSTLAVEELRMSRGGSQSIISGRMPLGFAFGSKVVVPEQAMRWQVDIPNGDVALAKLLLPQIGTAAGRFAVHAGVTGTPRHPDLDGTMQVRDATVRMSGREEVFTGVSASIRLDESHIRVDSLVARQGQHGRVAGSGRVELQSGGLKGYHFDLVADNVSSTEPGVYAALFDGHFTVTDGPSVHGESLPFVTGTAVIHRAVIFYNFADVSETEEVATTAEPLYWTYRIQLSADNNIHWQPPEGDIEFNANLSVEQTPDQLLIYGDMKSIRGTYYFLSNRFDVRNADLTFDNVSGVNPQIDASAVTRVVPVAADTTVAGGSNNITVRITGRAREPVIDLSSEPEHWDEARILKELTIGRFGTRNVASIGDPVDNYVTRALNRTLSAEMSRAFRGYINEWELERERGGLIGGEGDVVLGLGSQVTSKLQLRYRQRVPGVPGITHSGAGSTLISPFERNIEAEYRLSRFVYLTTEYTQPRNLNNTPGQTITSQFNVNLKARWEY